MSKLSIDDKEIENIVTWVDYTVDPILLVKTLADYEPWQIHLIANALYDISF